MSKWSSEFVVNASIQANLAKFTLSCFPFLASFQEHICEFYMGCDENPSALVPMVLDL